MKKLFAISVCLLALGLAVRTTLAAPIVWDNVQNISGPASTTVTTAPNLCCGVGPGNGATINNGTLDVNTQGTMVFGVNWSGAAGVTYPYDVTINGQTFLNFRANNGSGNPTGPITQGAIALTTSFGGVGPYFTGTGPAGQSYGNYNQAGVNGYGTDYTLQNAAWGSPNETMTMSGLTPGQAYLLQFWASDPRGGILATRGETITGSAVDVDAPTLHYEAARGNGGVDGQWVVGRFVADASGSETLNLTGFNVPGTGDAGSARTTCSNSGRFPPPSRPRSSLLAWACRSDHRRRPSSQSLTGPAAANKKPSAGAEGFFMRSPSSRSAAVAGFRTPRSSETEPILRAPCPRLTAWDAIRTLRRRKRPPEHTLSGLCERMRYPRIRPDGGERPARLPPEPSPKSPGMPVRGC